MVQVLRLAQEDPEGYRIWTANWTKRLQNHIAPHFLSALSKSSVLSLRQHLATLSTLLIKAVTGMWALKMCTPIHPNVADRLTTDMAHLAHLFPHSKAPLTLKTSRFGSRRKSLIPHVHMKHRTLACSLQQLRMQRYNNDAKMRRLAKLDTMRQVAPVHITSYFSSDQSCNRTTGPGIPRKGEG